MKGEKLSFNMFWNVYVLYSPSSKQFYTGMTQDLERRIKEHNTGKTKSTIDIDHGNWSILKLSMIEFLLETGSRT